ncbi:sigma-70 family RNA polymerase sigma factor [Streptomyces sp. NPDC005283]|uniref:sigma-70 family RNA polymerase sigma factor n=1 Tax=Streptomyces sp. NPDC005283 TaxID=3156871 RepID=UPI0034520C08
MTPTTPTIIADRPHALVVGVASHSPEQFSRFYAQSFRSLVAMAYSRTHDWATAQDVVQDIFASLVDRWETIEEPERYLRRAVARNASRYAPGSGRVLPAGAAEDMEDVVHDPLLGDFTDTLDLERTVEEEIRALPDMQRAVVASHMADCSITEIAEDLNITASTVRSHLTFARRRLRKRLQEAPSSPASAVSGGTDADAGPGSRVPSESSTDRQLSATRNPHGGHPAATASMNEPSSTGMSTAHGTRVRQGGADAGTAGNSPSAAALPRSCPDRAVTRCVLATMSGGSTCLGAGLPRQHADAVYAYLAYWARSRSEAVDLTDEALSRARQAIGRRGPRDSNSCLQLLAIARTLKPRPGSSVSAPEADHSVEEHRRHKPERPSNTALLEAMRALTLQQQDCLALRFLVGLSVSATAQTMGRREGAVRTLQYRAIRTLQQQLRPAYPAQAGRGISAVLDDCGRHYRDRMSLPGSAGGRPSPGPGLFSSLPRRVAR